MNVKKHKWLVWAMLISLMLGVWDGSVAKGEENNPPVATGKLGQITQVKLEMGELNEEQKLPSNVEITEVQVETSAVEIAGIESPAVESAGIESPVIETVSVETISWESCKTVGEEFTPINDWNKHSVQGNTAYKVKIMLKTEKFIFKNGVEVCISIGNKQLQEIKIERVSDTKIQVSGTYVIGTLATPPSAMPPETITPSTSTPPETITPPTPTPPVTPTATPTVSPVIQQPAVIDTISVEGVKPPVGDVEFPEEEIEVSTKFSGAIATIEPDWYSETGEKVKKGETAEYGKTYVLWIQLTANGEYEFNENLDPVEIKDIDGKLLEKNDFEVVHDEENKEKVTIKCTFEIGPEPIQSPKVINKLYVEGVEAPSPSTAFPEENLKIRTNFSSGNNNEDVIKEPNIVWKNEEGKEIQEGETVNFDETYSLCITLTAEKEYVFAEKQGLSIKVNDELVNTYEIQDGKKVIITCEFRTEKKPVMPPPLEVTKIDGISVEGVEVPVDGKEFPEEELEVSTNLRKEDHPEAIATIEPDWYNETDEKVKKGETATLGKKYVLRIKLTAGDGYGFNEIIDPVEIKDKEGNSIEKNDFEVVHDQENKGKVVIIKCTFEAKENPDQPTPAPAPAPPTAEPPSVSPPATYTVTLDANGGKFKNTKQKKKTITFTAEELKRGAVEDLPTKGEITKKGYILIGWYKGKTRVKEITEPGNVTLKAQWVAKSVTMGYPGGTLKWKKFKLSSDVKLTDVKLTKYKSYVKIDKKKKVIKAKKYFKKANLILKIDGEDVKGVTLKMELPEPEIRGKATIKRKRYATGVYTTYKITYKYKKYKGARVEARYSYKKNGGYKKCVNALNQPKGGLVSVKQGTTVYMKVKIYYGNACSVSKRILSLKG